MRDRLITTSGWIFGVLATALVTAAACGGSEGSTVNGGDQGGASASGGSAGVGVFGGTGAGVGTDGSSGGGGPCVNLECQQVTCPGGGTTSLSGTIYDPSGTLPLYNVAVYVPNAALGDIGTGASCDQCDATLSGDPVVTTVTDTKGQFTLKDVPVGNDIPLVIQVGKWRRQVNVQTVTECVNTPLTDPQVTRLPKSQAEGHLPRIALTTGGADALECLLRKIGIDQSEFTPEGGSGRINFYAGEGGTDRYSNGWNGGASFSGVNALWDSVETLSAYDVVLLSCEGTEDPNNKSQAARQAMQDYTTAGGRVFASHWHNYWIEFGPDPFPTVATFNHQDDLNDITADIDTSFPKGQALAEWLVNVAGSTTLGKVDITAAQHTIDAVNDAVAQRWIYSSSPTSVQYLSFNTQMGIDPNSQCGRMVLSDIHVSSGDSSSPDDPYPDGCTTTDLSPQEKVLIFMLFDLSACINPDDEPPPIPGPR